MPHANGDCCQSFQEEEEDEPPEEDMSSCSSLSLLFSLSDFGHVNKYSFICDSMDCPHGSRTCKPETPDAPRYPPLWWCVRSLCVQCVNHICVIIQYKLSSGLSVKVQCVGEGFLLAAAVERHVVTAGVVVIPGWLSCSRHAGTVQLASPRPFHCASVT